MNKKNHIMEFNGGRSLSLEFNISARPLFEQQLKLKGAVKEREGIELSSYRLDGEELLFIHSTFEDCALIATGEKVKAILKKFANDMGIS